MSVKIGAVRAHVAAVFGLGCVPVSIGVWADVVNAYAPMGFDGGVKARRLLERAGGVSGSLHVCIFVWALCLFTGVFDP